MTLTELKSLTKKAQRITKLANVVWYTAAELRLHLSADVADLVAALTPEGILAMIAVCEAAEKLDDSLQDGGMKYIAPVGQCEQMNKAIVALKEILS